VSTLYEMIQLHQFQFNYILTLSHCYALCTSTQLLTYIFVFRITKIIPIQCSWSSYDNFYL